MKNVINLSSVESAKRLVKVNWAVSFHISGLCFLSDVLHEYYMV